MRFTILATIFATAATVVVAVPVHVPQSTTSVVPAGEPSEHSALVLGNGREEKHNHLLHHHENEEKEKEEDDTEGEEHKETSHHATEQHPSLSRRQISMADAQAHARNYKKLEKTHTEAAMNHLTTAGNQAHDPNAQATHTGLAVNHATLANKANHLHQAYAHEVKAQRSDAKAAAAVPGSASHTTHTNNAANARVVSNHHFAQANAINAQL
ncbi:hypothetical protein FRC14_000062 [Serendipita sp. 396]|nr:hypothetical protein FRC14_000062 [Serendipita sp. 396]KAG8789857.1 hypothetical protein FRC15_000049 [Serendipita sp. 397]KAG8804801.1 hypothetical protein FRC16_000055 [Serendipita sp. 398]KAG8826325.1 hypothetical protein FRC19_009285 [Serendipita sp. 401]KAG8847219.1 hypothetical protein FRB91_011988 [Serendipita sp. 411]KAG8879471.1 hypothetical protein FRC20_000043 [Serendipita sp. 405]KAG9057064.1 hypothetical protein FS842_008726 [Serendipita sp. 407]